MKIQTWYGPEGPDCWHWRILDPDGRIVAWGQSCESAEERDAVIAMIRSLAASATVEDITDVDAVIRQLI